MASNERRSAVSIPAQAFFETHPQKLEPGRLFKLRGNWALRVAFGNDNIHQGFVLLQGECVGQLMRLGEGMARSIAIGHPFSWFPSVEVGAEPKQDVYRTATLTVGPTGPVIIGEEASRGNYDPDPVAFGSDGLENEDYDPHGGVIGFNRWTVELQHITRPFISLGTIASIDRSKPKG